MMRSQRATLQPSLWSTRENKELTEAALRRGKEQLLIPALMETNKRLIDQRLHNWDVDLR